MTKRVSAAEAKTHLSKLLYEVEIKDERIIIERRGKPVAALVPVEALSSLPDSAEEGMGFLAAVKAAQEEPEDFDDEIDQMIKEIYEDRRRDVSREVNFEE